MLRQFCLLVAIVSNQIKTKSTPRRGGFTFKQFFVAHDRCAMKVGYRCGYARRLDCRG
ncbi:tRNA1(Val) (adenine(37)-N6)-methyltransferase [Serratia fonticola]|uniref:tRNA1(Val) (Adenine(37)-N6)-methyltransferase n=1 Tax=Serratia fonticola TaxID=47917 RepID=A0A4U9UI41_SERFO|nr:tRNA1(Val) (adenine(37)-N6)-methyltransferase [Serratia fonticola]